MNLESGLVLGHSSEEQQREWVEHSLCIQNPLSRPPSAVAKYRIFMQIQFPDHTGYKAHISTAGFESNKV